jgi:hypothetical protein
LAFAAFAALVGLAHSSVCAPLVGYNWFADKDTIQVIGKTSISSSNGKFCSSSSGKLECGTLENSHKPDYYLLVCERNRGICDGTIAVILLSGEPWMAKTEYEIKEWTPERVIAVRSSLHACVVTTMLIDLKAQEVLFTETYTRYVEQDPFCIPENIGHTTTYKLENY